MKKNLMTVVYKENYYNPKRPRVNCIGCVMFKKYIAHSKQHDIRLC